MDTVLKPRWTPSSYLIYAGSLLVLAASLGALSYLSRQYGDAAYAAWALLVFAVLQIVAVGLHRRGSRLAAGVFGFVAVLAFAGFVGALWAWWGWLPRGETTGPFAGFQLGLLSLELLTLIAAQVALRRFRHPLPVSIVALVGWLFVTDIVSNGGNWTAVVTLVIGLVYLLAGTTIDRGPRRPYGFWLHLVSGLLIGGSLLYWWHGGDTSWVLVCLAGVLFVLLGDRTRRASWAVFGSIGLVAAATHFSLEWSNNRISLFPPGITTFRGWVPSLVFAVLGFLLVGFGLASLRRHPDDEAVGESA